MKLSQLTISACLGLGALALSNAPASAVVVCSGPAGDCWHTTETYTYPSDAGVVIHPEGWKWGADEHYKWREHEGRGYWGHDGWRAF